MQPTRALEGGARGGEQHVFRQDTHRRLQLDPSRTLNKIDAALKGLSLAASLAAASEEAYKADAAALEDLLAHVAWGAEG